MRSNTTDLFEYEKTAPTTGAVFVCSSNWNLSTSYAFSNHINTNQHFSD